MVIPNKGYRKTQTYANFRPENDIAFFHVYCSQESGEFLRERFQLTLAIFELPTEVNRLFPQSRNLATECVSLSTLTRSNFGD